MLKLLNNPKSDNTRNILNADLFVSNLHNTLKAFGFNPKVTYEVYRSITVYHITWNDDKIYDDILELKKEIALSLGINVSELVMNKVKDNEIFIKVDNMKKDILCLKEVLENYKVDNDFKVVLGLDEYDKLVTFDFDKEKSLLVTGVSGTGKTNLFNDIIMNILINYSNVKVVILDSQGINYNLYSDVCEVVNKEEDIIVKINLLRREFEDRVKNNTRDKMVVFIDEIYEILKLDNSVKDDINYLLEVGSTMGIYLVVSTDSVLEDDTYDLFNKDNVSKISFYLTLFITNSDTFIPKDKAISFFNSKISS
jgi:DNA segregation ATPase FtsK/SpoIIIE-like protein